MVGPVAVLPDSRLLERAAPPPAAAPAQCADCGQPAGHQQGGEWFCCGCFEAHVQETMLALERTREVIDRLQMICGKLARELK